NDGSGCIDFPEFPTLSPDGKWTVFSWAGDLWITPTTGGAATRLTAHPADERRSAFSPDGHWLAFESDRDGAPNLYVTRLGEIGGTPAVGEIERVTVSDRPETLGGFSADGKSLFFSGDRSPTIFNGSKLYRVELHETSAGFTGCGGVVTALTNAFG